MKFSTTLSLKILYRPKNKTDIDWMPLDEGPGYFDLSMDDEIALYLPRAEDETVLMLAEEWLGCPMLRMVDVSEGRRMTNTGLHAISRLKQVTMLNLGSCGISNEGLEFLCEMPDLTWLDISHCTGIGDKGLLRIEQMKQLEFVDLHGLRRVTTGGYKRLAKRKTLKIRR
ncbi:MAG: hypothetical protein K8R40_05680 [Anaerolineaceae bacterium]|nr:hypothetical protein [Anaerolineaceae bacterium]